MSEDDLTLNLDGLDALARALRRDPPQIRVGILGAGGARSDGRTNAQVGVNHEFGAPRANLPRRSFLREPLADRMPEALEASGAFDKDSLAHVLRERSLLTWARKVAALAEAVVLGAFDSGGYGKWAPLKPATLRRKRNAQILVETQQLRNSVATEVKE